MRKCYQKGTTTVEFAIVGTLFFVVLFAVIEIGRALFVWNTITESTRRGARVAAVCPVGHSSVPTITILASPGSGPTSPILHGLTTGNVQIDYLDDANNTTLNYADIKFVRVGINNYQHTLLIPLYTRTITVPSFSTTYPAESLGYIPDTGERKCFGA